MDAGPRVSEQFYASYRRDTCLNFLKFVDAAGKLSLRFALVVQTLWWKLQLNAS